MNKKQKNGVLGFVFVLSMSISFAQEQQPAEVSTLLRDRIVLSEKNQNYTELERQMVALGHVPAALVTKSEHEGKVKFEFVSYKNIRADREQAIADRLKASVPGVDAVVIQNQHVSVTFNASATEGNITEFFRLSGYNLYEIKR